MNIARTTRSAETRNEGSWHNRRMRISPLVGALVVVGSIALPSVAHAQMIQLNAGFGRAGAQALQGMSGGPFQGQNMNPSCRGYVNGQPAHVIVTRTGFQYLRMFVVSQGDTTLIVRGPTGVQCNDDTYGLNPALDLNGMPPGRYEIFVGSYQQNAQNPYSIYFTENSAVQPDNVANYVGGGQMMGGPANGGMAVPPNNGGMAVPPPNNGNGSGWGAGNPNNGGPQYVAPPVPSGLRTDLRPTGGRIQIRGPLRRTERRISRIANANRRASDLHGTGTCRGYIAEAPSYVVDVASPQPFLRFFLASAADTTLVIQHPDGHVECSDDSFGGLQPSIEGSFQPGQYFVWAGIYREGMARPYRLSITSNQNEHP